MKNKLLTFLLAALVAASAYAAEPAPAKPAAPDPVAAVIKERDDARASLAAAQTQAQQSQIAAEFYKASSERDQAFLRLIGIQQQLEAANKEIESLRVEIATLKKPVPPAAPAVTAPAIDKKP